MKVAGKILAVALCCCTVAIAPAHAQTGGAPSPALPELSQPTPEPRAEGAKPILPETLPDSAVERAKMLDNLYALLATAEDEQAAERTTNAIARLWSESGSDTVSLLSSRALKAVQEKNYALALKMLDAVVEQAPDYAEGWSQRAHVLYLDGQVERAVGDLRRALALDANHFRALSTLAHILREVGEKKGALMAYRKLLEVHPFAPGAKQVADELQREVDGQGI